MVHTKPEIIKHTSVRGKLRLAELVSSVPKPRMVDYFEEALEEEFRILFPFIETHASEYSVSLKRFLKKRLKNDQGVWVYLPWRNTLVHVPGNDEYQRIRTSRNRNLITPEEQELFYQSRIGIAGLSVGFSALQAIVLSGGARNLRIADGDTLSLSNLNRLPSSISDLGANKSMLAARRIYEINPFHSIELFSRGLTKDSLKKFMQKDGKKLDLFVEEMDSINLKIQSRMLARELKIPVIMATDNGDNSFIDVERFDLEPKRSIFHGNVDEEYLASVPDKLSLNDKARLAMKIVGPDITPRTQLSISRIGSQLPAFPQLGNAAALSGVLCSYVALRILTGKNMPSGRYEINIDKSIDPDYLSEDSVAYREQVKADFVNGFTLLYGE